MENPSVKMKAALASDARMPETASPESEARTPVEAVFEAEEESAHTNRATKTSLALAQMPSASDLAKEKSIKKDAAREARKMDEGLSEQQIDQTVEDSFPASDPPSH